jgi:hypothetical protein
MMAMIVVTVRVRGIVTGTVRVTSASVRVTALSPSPGVVCRGHSDGHVLRGRGHGAASRSLTLLPMSLSGTPGRYDPSHFKLPA